MIHLHRISTLVAVFLCVTFFSDAQETASNRDTSVCQLYKDSVDLYSYRYDANDSLRYYTEKVLACTESQNDMEGYMEALSVLGVTCIRANNLEEALVVFDEYLEIAEEMDDAYAQAQGYINVATVYTRMDSAAKAMELLLISAELFEAQQDSFMLSYVYTNIGILFGKIRERKEQLYYSKMAFAVSGGIIKNRHTLTLATNLAVNYQNSGILDTAEVWGIQVLEKSREFGNMKTTTQILAHLANNANRLEKYEKAVEYVNEVLTYEGKLEHDQTFASVYTYRGIASLKLGSPKEAILNLKKGLEYSTSEKSLQRKEVVLKHLQAAYAQNGNYQDAYRTLLDYKTATDTLGSLETVRILNDLETKYETDKKEQQLRELGQKNRINALKVKQRNIGIGILAVLALLIVGSVYLVSRQRLLKQQQVALENRLQSLRVQLNPHFIFNALTAVQNYILSGKDLKQSTRYLSNFAKVMRAFLEYNQEETISLDKEIHAIELYMGIQKLRFSESFEFIIEMDDDLLPEETLLPPMMLQPFLENAIEHGVRNVENAVIKLNYKLVNDQLHMTIIDNGVGRTASAQLGKKAIEKTSLATKITEERISLLNGRKGMNYSFQIADLNEDGSGTVVTFRIPFIET